MAATKVDKALRAMQRVYGAFQELSLDAAAKGLPAANSGGHHHPNGRSHYLWTDSFGVLNMISLWKATHDAKYLALSKQLVHSVHETLGRTRDGRSRLPGATDHDPMLGGLRIGKVEGSGPDGDGQYHHYLTLWMFALNRLARASNEMRYNDLAISLARAIHPRFLVNASSGTPAMVWKISMDMSRPLVYSQGNLDAVTGYVVYRLLQATSNSPSCLASEIDDYRRIMDSHGPPHVSSDTLDLGMGLWIAQWDAGVQIWAGTLARECHQTLTRLLSEQKYTPASLKHRLAFREFGALLGIECFGQDAYLESRVGPITEMWETWLDESGERLLREDLEPITMVMYAAVVLPTAFRKDGLAIDPQLTSAGL